MDCLSSEDLKGRRLNSLYLTAYAESWCCQVGNVRDRGWQRPKQTEQQTGTFFALDSWSRTFETAMRISLTMRSGSSKLMSCVAAGSISCVVFVDNRAKSPCKSRQHRRGLSRGQTSRNGRRNT
jgi:hypothetical protein